MRASRFVVLVALVAATATLQAQEPAQKPDPKAVFAETDTNGDGMIDHDEFQDRIVDVFYVTDANKDGFLSPDEFKQLPFSENFTEADSDGNQRLSLHEFVRIRTRQCDAADTNHDGELSLDEVITVYEGRKSK